MSEKNEYGVIQVTPQQILASMDQMSADEIKEQKNKYLPLQLRIKDRTSKLLQFYQLLYEDFNMKAELVNLIEDFVENFHREDGR